MAKATIETTLGIDLRDFIQGMKTATNIAQSGIREIMRNPARLTVDGKGALSQIQAVAGAFDAARSAGMKTSSELRSALAGMAASGQKGSAEYKQVAAQLRLVEGETRKLDKATEGVEKEFGRVGAEGAKMSNGLMGSLSGIGAAVGGILSVGAAFHSVLDQGMAFQNGMADVSAITGFTGKELDALGTSARDLGKKFGTEATSQLDLFKGVLSRLGPEMAEQPAALQSIADSINTLSKASGDDAATSMDALTTSMLQFRVDLSDPIAAAEKMKEMMNDLAKGAQVGAAEIPQVSQAVTVAGTALAGANIKFSETNALIQVVAQNAGKYGSEAGIGIRNVVGLLQKNSQAAQDTIKSLGISFDDLGKILTTKGMAPALEYLRGGLDKLGSDAQRNAAMLQIFGAENASVADAMIRGTDKIKEWTNALEGDNSSAVDQAAVRMGTLSEELNRLKARLVDAAITAFQETSPGFSSLAETIGGKLEPIIKALPAILQKVGEGLSAVVPIIGAAVEITIKYGPAILALISAYKLYTFASQTAIPAVKGLNAAMAANPIGAVITGLSILIPLVGSIADAFSTSTQELIDNADAEMHLNEEMQKTNASQQEQQRGAVKLASEYIQLANKGLSRSTEETKRLHEVEGDLNDLQPGLISNTKSFGEQLQDVKLFADDAQNALRSLSVEAVQLGESFKQLQIDKSKLAQRQLAEELGDTLGDAYNTIGNASKMGAFGIAQYALGKMGVTSVLTDVGQEEAKGVNDLLQSATTLQEVDVTTKKLLDRVKENTHLSDSESVKARMLLAKMAQLRKEQIELESGANKEAKPSVAQAPPPPTDNNGGDNTPTEPDQERIKLLAQLQDRIRKELSEKAIRSIHDERKRELRALDETNKEELHTTEQAFKKLGEKNAQYEGLLTLMRENNLSVRNEKVKDLTERGFNEQMSTWKSGLSALAETLSQQEASITGDSAQQLEKRQQIHLDAQAAQLDSLRAGLLSENAEWKQYFQNLDEQYLSGKLDYDQYRLAIVSGFQQFAATIDDPRISALLAKFQQENATAAAAISDAWESAFSSILPDLQQTADDSLAVLNRWLAFQLTAFQGNEEAIDGILRAYDKKRKDITEQRAKQAAEAEANAVFDGLAIQQAAVQGYYQYKQSLREKDLEEARKAAGVELAILRRQVKAGLITYRQYADDVGKIVTDGKSVTPDTEVIVRSLKDAVNVFNSAGASAFAEIGQQGAKAFADAFKADDGKISSALAEQLANLDFSGFSDAAGKASAEGGKFLQGAVGQFVGIVSEAGLSHENMAKAAAKTTIQIAFQTLQALVPIWSAQILGGSLASPESILTGGALGIVKWAALTALMEAAVVGVEAVAMSALGFMRGGYTGDGPADEPAGIVHKGELVLTKEQVAELQRVLPGIKGRGGAAVVMRAAQAAGVVQVGPASGAAYAEQLRGALGNPSPERIEKVLRADVSPLIAAKLQGGAAAAQAAPTAIQRDDTPSIIRHKVGVELGGDFQIKGDDLYALIRKQEEKRIDAA